MTTTVIIINWNSGALLAECLRHLERQTVQPDWVLVVDNASSDNSVAGAEAFTNVTVRRLNANIFGRASSLASLL